MHDGKELEKKLKECSEELSKLALLKKEEEARILSELSGGMHNNTLGNPYGELVQGIIEEGGVKISIEIHNTFVRVYEKLLRTIKEEAEAGISKEMHSTLVNLYGELLRIISLQEQKSAEALLEAHTIEVIYEEELKQCFEGVQRCSNDLRECSAKRSQIFSAQKQKEDEGARVNSAIAKLRALEQLNEQAARHLSSRVYKCNFQLVEDDGNTVRNTLQDGKGGLIWGHQIEVTGHKPRKLKLYLGIPRNEEEGRDAFLRVGNGGEFVPIKDGLDSLAERPLDLPSRLSGWVRSAKGYCSEGRKYHKRLATEVEEERADAAKARQEKIVSLQKKIASLQDERNKLSQDVVGLHDQVRGSYSEEAKLKSKIGELKSKSEEIERKIEEIKHTKGELGVECARGKVAELNKKIKEYVNCDFRFNLTGSYYSRLNRYILTLHNERDETDGDFLDYNVYIEFRLYPTRSGSIINNVWVACLYNDRDYESYDFGYRHDDILVNGRDKDKERFKKLLNNLTIPFSSKPEPSIPLVTEVSKDVPSRTLESTKTSGLGDEIQSHSRAN